MSEPHPLDGLLEPASAPYRDAALVSIAISLKRLADHLAPNDGVHQAPLLWLGDVLLECSQRYVDKI